MMLRRDPWRSARVLLAVLAAVLLAAAPLPAAPASTAALRTFEAAYAMIVRDHVSPPPRAALLRGAFAGLEAALARQGFALRATPGGDEARDLEQIVEVIARAPAATGGRVSDADAAHAAILGMVAALNDPHSAFIPAEAFRQALGIGPGYGGIGIAVNFEGGRPVVAEVFEETPAQRAGLRPGDVIAEIDGRPTQAMDPQEVVAALRGRPGTPVRLRLLRDGQPAEAQLVRGVIQPRRVTSRMLMPDVGYIRLGDFSDGTGDEVGRRLAHLVESGARGIVLDLRGNPGGSLDESVKVASLFLRAGTVTSLVARAGPGETFPVLTNGSKFTGPVVVLVDGGSASASEVVAGALQDNGVRVVGTKSLGKGSVQSLRRLPDGSGLRLTIAHFLTPRGTRVEGRGIQPDVVATTPAGTMGTDQDRQLQAALQLIRSRLGARVRAAA